MPGSLIGTRRRDSPASGAAARRILPLLVSLLLLPARSAPAAEKPPRDTPVAPGIQREQVNLVLIDVVVTDKDGTPVEDLRPGDFSLVVDGRAVKIQSVDLLVAEAVTAGGAPPETEPATRPPEGPPAVQRVPRGRGIVLFFDGVGCERGLGPEAIESARRFVRAGIGPDDEAMVAGLGSEFKIYQAFTQDATAMLAALDQIAKEKHLCDGGQYRTESNLELLKDLADFHRFTPGGGPVTSLAKALASEETRRVDRFFSVLGALTGILRAREGRKEVFLFSDGFPLSPEKLYELRNAEDKTPDLLRASREAAAAQVVLNPVSTLGLTGPDKGLIAGVRGPMQVQALRALTALALNTGGVLIHDTNGHFENPMRNVERESRATYQLAYAPEGEPDGKLHSTRVSVSRKGAQVRAQEGFLWMTETQRKEREILSAYMLPELFREIPVSVLARTYLEADGKPAVEVAIALSGSALLFRPQEGGHGARLEAGGILRSSDGKVEKRFSRNVTVRLSEEEGGKADEFTLLARDPVPPGDYEATAVVRDLDSGRLGASRATVKIPSLSPEHLAMSSLTLSRSASPPRRIDLDPAGSGERLQKVPDVRLVFSPGEQVIASSVIYHPRRDPVSREASVILLASIHGPDGFSRKVLSLRRPIAADDLRDSFPVEFPADLHGLEPGLYELNVEAWDEKESRGVLQKVEFLVR